MKSLLRQMKIIYLLLFLLVSFQYEVYAHGREKEFLEELKKIHDEKKIFLERISKKEDECLAKFFSGKCLEDLDVQYETGVRDFEMRNQKVLRKRRELRSEIRENKRQRRLEIRSKTNR